MALSDKDIAGPLVAEDLELRLSLPARWPQSPAPVEADQDSGPTAPVAASIDQVEATPEVNPRDVPASPLPPAVMGLFPTGIEMARFGRVEIMSTEFAAGWATVGPRGEFTLVIAVLGSEVIGSSLARLSRDDLDLGRSRGELNAYAFTVVFDRPIDRDQLNDVRIISPYAPEPLEVGKRVKLDRSPPLRVFLMGSPRSGTSEMGATLAATLDLPWDGEGHAAPLFAQAATALTADQATSHNLVRFVATQDIRQIVIDGLKRTYYTVHSSASFLDKTPGAAMVRAAPFLLECFPDARFIFLRRHPVGNIMSRMAKFGGVFEEHCEDWAATMTAWVTIRTRLPHFLEVEQETMLSSPMDVGADLAAYLGRPSSAPEIGASLSMGKRERTGAGLGRSTLGQTGWTETQMQSFCAICGPAVTAFQYELLS